MAREMKHLAIFFVSILTVICIGIIGLLVLALIQLMGWWFLVIVIMLGGLWGMMYLDGEHT